MGLAARLLDLASLRAGLALKIAFFQCGAFLLEIADMLMHQPVVGG